MMASNTAALEASPSDLRAWDARTILVTEKEVVESALVSARASPELWLALGIDNDKSALIIADRWGVVYFAKQTNSFADLPTPPQVEEWAR